jgi:hypothetical protein
MATTIQALHAYFSETPNIVGRQSNYARINGEDKKDTHHFLKITAPKFNLKTT